MNAAREALRLARAVGVDLEGGVVGRVAGKRVSDLDLWDSARRAAAGALGPADGSRGMIDALHHAAHAARGRSVAAAAEMLASAGLDRDPRFFTALEAVLEVLPPSKTFTGIALEGVVERRRAATSRRSTACTAWPATTASTNRTSCVSGGKRADGCSRFARGGGCVQLRAGAHLRVGGDDVKPQVVTT